MKDAAQEITTTDFSAFAIKEGAERYVLYLSVDGMHCASCAQSIESFLGAEKGVTARVSLAQKRLVLRWKGPRERGAALIHEAQKLGYTYAPFDPAQIEQKEAKSLRLLRFDLLFSGLVTVFLMVGASLWPVWLKAALASLTVLLAGRTFFVSAWAVLRHGGVNMDVPIVFSLFLTLACSFFDLFHPPAPLYFDSAVMLIFFLLIGRYLDAKARGQTRAAALDLLSLSLGQATILAADGSFQRVPISTLSPDQILCTAAGEKIAADGVIVDGASEIDSSLLTGESLPRAVKREDKVFAGCLNLLAPVRIRITATSADSLLGDIIRLMERAEQGNARFVRLADKVAKIYVPSVFFLATLTFLLWLFAFHAPWQQAFITAMAVLIITCPCAMGLAVPAVQVLASGLLFRQNILLKSADALEKASTVDTIVFDKTGTLTLGKPRLVHTNADPVAWALATALAQQSRHPLAQALAAAGPTNVTPAQDVEEIPGQGLKGRVGDLPLRLGRREWCGSASKRSDQTQEVSELWLCRPGQEPVLFTFEDSLKADARETMAALHKEGYTLYLFSGDRPAAVAAAARAAGIDHFMAALSPTEKTAEIEKRRAAGASVLMVGDGLNDAPSLLAASVSLSPASGADITQNAADAVFKGSLLAPVLSFLTIARAAQRLVRQNFGLAIFYNALAVPLAMAGFVTPPLAAAAMSLSSLLVVLNARRLSRF